TGAVLPADIHRAAGQLEIRHVAERDVHPFRCIDQNIFEMAKGAFRLFETDDYTEMFFALPEFGRFFSGEAGLDHVLNIGDIEPITGRALAIDINEGLRDFAGAIDESARNAGNIGDRTKD